MLLPCRSASRIPQVPRAMQTTPNSSSAVIATLQHRAGVGHRNENTAVLGYGLFTFPRETLSILLHSGDRRRDCVVGWTTDLRVLMYSAGDTKLHGDQVLSARHASRQSHAVCTARRSLIFHILLHETLPHTVEHTVGIQRREYRMYCGEANIDRFSTLIVFFDRRPRPTSRKINDFAQINNGCT